MRESVDIYAYAIFCTEVLNSGEIPWACWSDEDIRRGVLGESHIVTFGLFVRSSPIEGNLRPDFTRDHASKLGVLPTIEACWSSSPDLRPRFRRVVKILKNILAAPINGPAVEC